MHEENFRLFWLPGMKGNLVIWHSEPYLSLLPSMGLRTVALSLKRSQWLTHKLSVWLQLISKNCLPDPQEMLHCLLLLNFKVWANVCWRIVSLRVVGVWRLFVASAVTDGPDKGVKRKFVCNNFCLDWGLKIENRKWLELFLQ